MRTVQVDGRDLAAAGAGPESGFPVVVHNGTGSRHLFPVADARRAGFRLIGYDRPGLGRSAALPGRVVADCAADVRAILADLGIARAAVWGNSTGGPYALATAALLPEMTAAVCLFAPLGPYGAPDWTSRQAWGRASARRSVFSSRIPAGHGPISRRRPGNSPN